MDCRIVFVLLSFDVCVLEQLVHTYGFLARGMTILKGQIPQNTDVFFYLKCRCVFWFLVAECSAHFGASKKGGPKTSIFDYLAFLGASRNYWYCCYLLEMAMHSCSTTLWAILGEGGGGIKKRLPVILQIQKQMWKTDALNLVLVLVLALVLWTQQANARTKTSCFVWWKAWKPLCANGVRTHFAKIAFAPRGV